jgi:hypothetical protein
LVCHTITLSLSRLISPDQCPPTGIDVTRYHYHTISNPQVTNLLHLAKALVSKLGYHRSRTVKDRRQILMNDLAEPSGAQGVNTVSPSSETLEEWRALAGCFMLTSMFVHILHRNVPYTNIFN